MSIAGKCFKKVLHNEGLEAGLIIITFQIIKLFQIENTYSYKLKTWKNRVQKFKYNVQKTTFKCKDNINSN